MVELEFALMKNAPGLLWFFILFHMTMNIKVFAAAENSAYIITQEDKRLETGGVRPQTS